MKTNSFSMAASEGASCNELPADRLQRHRFTSTGEMNVYWYVEDYWLTLLPHWKLHNDEFPLKLSRNVGCVR